MPFGGSCEYRNFGSCVGAIKRSRKLSDDRARAYCAELMRRTEAHCARRSQLAQAGVDVTDLDAELDLIEAILNQEWFGEN